jgi:hypothetical protein
MLSSPTAAVKWPAAKRFALYKLGVVVANRTFVTFETYTSYPQIAEN